MTATARNLEGIADLKERFADLVLLLQSDVTDRERALQVVNQAYEYFGRLDVLVNNAGYSLIATAEEASDKQIQDVSLMKWLMKRMGVTQGTVSFSGGALAPR